MGLFDRFQPGIYSPMLAQMGQQLPMQGPQELPALSPAATPTIPKKKGMFARFGTENEKGYSGWDGLQIAGATLRDIGNPQGQNVAALQEMMAAQQKAVAAEMVKQQERSAILAHIEQSDDPKLKELAAIGGPEAAIDYLKAAYSRAPVMPSAINLGDGGVAEYDPANPGHLNLLRPPEEQAPNAPVGYRWNGDKLEFVPGGPADPSVIGGNAGVRRQVVTTNPMPARPRAAAGPKAAATASKAPWERDW